MEAAGLPDGIKPLVHLSDFLMGIAAACAFELLQDRVRGWWLYLPGFAGVALAIIFEKRLPVDLNSTLRPLNGILLVGLALGCGALSNRVLVYLGKASYAMYILHVPIMWWYLRKSQSFSPMLYVAIVIAVSVIVYAVIEEPANRFLRARTARPRAA
jgi:peptidoglycan/LPS O-acetylase OafA/YrhL